MTFNQRHQVAPLYVSSVRWRTKSILSWRRCGTLPVHRRYAAAPSKLRRLSLPRWKRCTRGSFAKWLGTARPRPEQALGQIGRDSLPARGGAKLPCRSANVQLPLSAMSRRSIVSPNECIDYTTAGSLHCERLLDMSRCPLLVFARIVEDVSTSSRQFPSQQNENSRNISLAASATARRVSFQ